MAERKLPIGIQGFEKLRTDNFLYVDKTEYVYTLVHQNIPYLLSRPRRFGKSLLLSTLKAYWEGKKELFSGLAIEKLEEGNPGAWQPHPAFYFDFNGENYNSTPIDTVLDGMLCDWERIYGDQYRQCTLGERFQMLLELAAEKTGKRCVVLIDEYDKPLLDTISDLNIQNHIKEVFKGFFGRLKNADEFIQFILITGVTSVYKASIFSDLNQLVDVSLTERYADLCGFTEREIKEYLNAETDALARRLGITREACLQELKRVYDGYHFHPNAEGVYNPYSLLSVLYTGEIGSYWFETGTPALLLHRIKMSGFELKRFSNNTIYASESVLKGSGGDTLELVPLLYQTGYLTIVSYDDKRKRYTLGFPNEEVKYGFLESLMPAFIPKATIGNGLDIFTLDEYVENGELDRIKQFLFALFDNISYTASDDPFEHYFQSVIYVVFTLLGKLTQCEMRTYSGRIDCKVETQKYIYLFEFKRDESAKAALEQIDSKNYALPFAADSRKLYKIGVSFDSKSRKLADWASAES